MGGAVDSHTRRQRDQDVSDIRARDGHWCFTSRFVLCCTKRIRSGENIQDFKVAGDAIKHGPLRLAWFISLQ